MPTTQVTFSRINPAMPPHLLRDDELQTAQNIDLGLAPGAIVPRRGVDVFGTIAAGTAVVGLHRTYPDPSNIAAGPFYARTADGRVWRGSGNSWTVLASGGAGNQAFSIGSYQQYAVISYGAVGGHIKDDGSTTTDWIKQSPEAPQVTVSTLAPLDLLYTSGVFTVTEGVLVGGGATCTAEPSAAGRITFTITYASPKDLTTNAGSQIGDYGVHFVDLAFSDPAQVRRITQDYSIGDDQFYNYWHAEFQPQFEQPPAIANAETLVDGQLGVGTSTILPTRTQREAMLAALRDNPRASLSQISRSANTWSPWGVPRSAFQFVGNDPNAGGTSPWANIHALRITIEADSDTLVAMVKDPQIAGAEGYPLTDLDVGYAWWQTYATYDAAGRKLGESAASPPSTRVRLQNARAVVVQPGSPSGAHGITHIITYRQGGYTRDAYAVSTVSLGTTTITDTMPDLRALSLNYPLPRNLFSKTTFSPGIQAISPSWNDRVFVADGNLLRWSLPGQLDAFELNGYTQVGPVGDNIKALLPWSPGLIIVNQYSVYEFQGQDLEAGQWQLLRSGSKHGSIPPRVPCLTPYGIPLLNYDALTMYVPGQGEVELPWLMELYGDMFRGGTTVDPGYRKGARIPAINRGHLLEACACYAEGRLYLAVPTDGSSTNNTLFVIDFANQRVWWYTYQFSISSLLWDHQDSRLFAGTTDGRVMLLERGVYEYNTSGVAVNIFWNARTKQWAAPSDSVFQNVAVHAEGGTTLVQAFYDDPVSPLAGTISGSRQWHHLPLNGSFARTAEFNFSGSANDGTWRAIYGLSFDHLQDPERVRYYRTPYDDRGTPNPKTWDVANYSLEILGTGLVHAVTFVDTTAVMTATLSGPTNGRVWRSQSFPAATTGKIAYTTYTSTNTDVLFKVWDGPERFEARVEPPQVNTWRTDIESLDEAICDAFDSDINPAGTVLATVFVNNTAVATGTLTGSARQSFTTTIPVETYGRTLYVSYSGSGFQHYNTWYHRRPEPDRWTSYVSDKQGGEEHEWKVGLLEVAVFNGGTATATIFVDGTAISTATLTGSTRTQHVVSLPYGAFGRTIWASYSTSAGASAKHYNTSFQGTPEPPRVTSFRVGPFPLPAESHLKTWVPELDPLGGVVLGTLYADGTAVATATFSGSGRQRFDVGVDLTGVGAIRTGRTWEARYAGPNQFKHYDTQLNASSGPYKKRTWAFNYSKLGGASQVDLARFWSLQYDASSPCTCTYSWDIDGTTHTTGTLTLGAGHGYLDRISFKPGGWGRLFSLRLRFSQDCGVAAVNLDLLQEGIKGLSRRGIQGDPND